MYSVRRRSTSTAATRRRRGSSILEAIGAIALSGIAVFALVTNSVSIARMSTTAKSVNAATALAQEKLEQLRSMPLGAAQLAPGSYDEASPIDADGRPGGRYTRSWTVSANDTPRRGLRTVTVRVAWTDSRPHTTRLAAYVRCSTIPCS
jgi:Tfp pilus assembly protein PilV